MRQRNTAENAIGRGHDSVVPLRSRLPPALGVSDFILGDRIHHSATTIVYRAEAGPVAAGLVSSAERLCIKRLPTAHATADDIRRFETAFALGSAAHAACPDGVVEYLALVRDGDGLAIVTRHVAEGNLGQRGSARRIDVPEAVGIARALAETLHALHQARITHGDLKPGNVVMRAGRPVLIDFDGAAWLSRRNERVEWSDMPRTTLAYSAPEQTGRTNRVVDARADLYSLGVTLFELLTGRLPFESDDALALVRSLLASMPPRADALRPDLPRALGDVIARSLAKDPDERYQSAAGLAHDLARIEEALRAGRSLDAFTTGTQDRPAKLVVPQKLYGRDVPLSHLLRELRHTSRGGSAFAWVCGHAGIGKSALINELEPHVTATGGQFARGRYELMRRDTPMLAFATALSALVNRREVLEGGGATQRLAEELLRRLGPMASAAADLVPSMAPYLPATTPSLRGEERQVVRARRLAALSTVLDLLAEGEQPVVIAIDDLQWADDASLELLADIHHARTPAGVFLIAAFRPVDTAHPLTPLVEHAVNDVRAADRVARFDLGVLDVNAVRELLSDTVSLDKESLDVLADACLAGSGGNPFHLRALLVDLYETGALTPPTDAAATWRLDHAALDMVLRETPEGVVAFLTAKLADLPAASRALIEAAACVGARQTRADLLFATGLDDEALDAALAPVLDVGYLRRPAHDREGYRFLHDRVQQAAWESTDAARRVELHWRLGRALLERTGSVSDAGQSLARVATAAEHLSAAINTDPTVLVNVGTEQLRDMCDALFTAAERALVCAAFEQAAQLTHAARAVLGRDGNPWTHSPGPAQQALLMSARAAAGRSDLDELRRLIDEGSAGGLDAQALEPIHTGWLGAMFARGDIVGTLASGATVLAGYGVHIPAVPKMHHALARLARLKISMLGGLPKSIDELPERADPEALLAVRMLRNVQNAAYRVSEPAAIVCLAETALRARACGRTPEAGFAWAMASLIWIEAFDDVEGAHQLGSWAHLLIDEDARPDFKVDGLYGWTVLVRPWVGPLRETLDDLRQVWRLALRGGDARQIESVPSSIVFTRLFLGDPLHEVQRETLGFLDIQERYGHPVPDIHALAQFLACLRGEAVDASTLSGAFFDIDDRLAQIEDETSRASVALMAVMLAVIHGDARAAVAALPAARRESRGHRHIFTRALWPHYGALAVLMSLPTAGSNRRRGLHEVRQMIAQLACLRDGAPANIEHRIAHVRGALARAQGRHPEAQRHLTEAVRAARLNGWPHEAALIHEALADLYETAGDVAARNGHAREALYLVRRWEGTAKLAQLEARWPRLESSESRELESETLSSGFRATRRLDSTSVTRAARALSGEIDLDVLVTRLVDLAGENAGATRATLVRLHDGLPWYEATVASTPSGDRTVERIGRRADEWEDSERVCPTALLEESILLRQPHVIGDLRREGDLSRGLTAARDRGVRSLMRVPLVRNDEPQGLLILENDLAADTFSTDRVRVLEVLAAQAAISIDNAELYTQLRASLDTQVALTNANSRFVPQEFIASLGRTSIASVELGDSVERDMAVLFSDVRGFATLIEGMPASETIGFINAYLSAMEPAVMAHHGFVDSYIGDAIMALFAGGGADAVGAAVDMLRQLAVLNASRAELGQSVIRVGLGVHSGPLTMGTIGGAQRIKCGVIGDAVNLAARIESATKQYQVPLLASGSAIAQLGPELRDLTREVDRVRVVGREQPVTLHEVFAADDAPTQRAKLAVADAWSAALLAYRNREFRDAMRAFEAIGLLLPRDPVTSRWRERCVQLVNSPPGNDWDPVVTLAQK